jgi:hypothetical protein
VAHDEPESVHVAVRQIPHDLPLGWGDVDEGGARLAQRDGGFQVKDSVRLQALQQQAALAVPAGGQLPSEPDERGVEEGGVELPPLGEDDNEGVALRHPEHLLPDDVVDVLAQSPTVVVADGIYIVDSPVVLLQGKLREA